MSVREYIGARYVPIFGRKGEESIIWDNSAPYEPLTVVLYQGNSYTSRQFVPIGIDILNQDYWAETGSYNAQVEQYRQEVLTFKGRLDTVEEVAEKAQEGVTAEKTRAEAAEGELAADISTANAAIQAEKARAEAAEGELTASINAANTAIQAEKTRAEAAEGMLASDIQDINDWREWERRIESINKARMCGTINFALDWNTDYCEPSTWAGGSTSLWKEPILSYNPMCGYIEIHGTLHIKQDMTYQIPLGMFQIAGGSDITFESAITHLYSNSGTDHVFASNMTLYRESASNTVNVKLASNNGEETAETYAGMLISAKPLKAGDIVTINGFQQITYPQGSMILDFVSRDLAREAADIFAGWSRTCDYTQEIYKMTHSWNSNKTQPTTSQCAASVWCAYDVAARRHGKKFPAVPNGSTAWSFGDVISHAYPDEEMNFKDAQKGDIMLFMSSRGRVMYHTAIVTTDYSPTTGCQVMEFGGTSSMTNPNPHVLGVHTADGPTRYHIESERFIVRPWRDGK